MLEKILLGYDSWLFKWLQAGARGHFFWLIVNDYAKQTTDSCTKRKRVSGLYGYKNRIARVIF